MLALSMVTQVAETRASEPPGPTLVKMAPEPEAAPRVGLRVDAEGLGSGGDPVKAKIEETAKEVFAAEGFEGGERGAGPCDRGGGRANGDGREPGVRGGVLAGKG